MGAKCQGKWDLLRVHKEFVDFLYVFRRLQQIDVEGVAQHRQSEFHLQSRQAMPDAMSRTMSERNGDIACFVTVRF